MRNPGTVGNRMIQFVTTQDVPALTSPTVTLEFFSPVLAFFQEWHSCDSAGQTDASVKVDNKKERGSKVLTTLIKGSPSVLLALISPLVRSQAENSLVKILQSEIALSLCIFSFFQSNFGRTEKSGKSSQRLRGSHSPGLAVRVIEDERTASGDWHFKQSEGFSSEKAVSGMVMRERVVWCREQSQLRFPSSLPFLPLILSLSPPLSVSLPPSFSL